MPRKAREIPWLAERGGWYYACWYDAATARTRRLSLRTEDAQAARRRFAAWLLECEDEYAAGEQPSRLTIGSMLDDYLAEHVEKNCVEPRRQRSAIASLRLFFDTYSAGDVDIPACRRYLQAREMAGTQPATVRRELAVLRAALGHAVRWKRLAKADLPELELPPNSDPKTLVLSREQVHALANAGDDVLRLFVLTTYFTASRRTAIERMSWFQVDLERDTIALAKPGERVTKKRRPTVPIDPELRPHLVAARAVAKNEWLLGSGVRNIWARWMAGRTAAGLPAAASPHTLRHSRITHLLEDGVNMWVVAALAGDTVMTIDKTYAHASQKHLAKALREKGNG